MSTDFLDGKPLLDEIRAWLDAALPEVPPTSATGKALYYLHHQWHRLLRYLEDGRLQIDNNRIENAIRPFVLGHKNWLFCDTVGAKAVIAYAARKGPKQVTIILKKLRIDREEKAAKIRLPEKGLLILFSIGELEMTQRKHLFARSCHFHRCDHFG